MSRRFADYFFDFNLRICGKHFLKNNLRLPRFIPPLLRHLLQTFLETGFLLFGRALFVFLELAVDFVFVNKKFEHILLPQAEHVAEEIIVAESG